MPEPFDDTFDIDPAAFLPDDVDDGDRSGEGDEGAGADDQAVDELTEGPFPPADVAAPAMIDGGALGRHDSVPDHVDERAPTPEAPADDGLARRIAALERIEVELADVDRTLSRLDDGGYGSCEVCGQPIADERLAASPTASTCGDHDVLASG